MHVNMSVHLCTHECIKIVFASFYDQVSVNVYNLETNSGNNISHLKMLVFSVFNVFVRGILIVIINQDFQDILIGTSHKMTQFKEKSTILALMLRKKIKLKVLIN